METKVMIRHLINAHETDIALVLIDALKGTVEVL